MSWLFGMNQRPQDFSQFVPPAATGGDQDGGGDSGNGKGMKGGAMEAYRFDSSALERAAKAAKDLEKSGVWWILHGHQLDYCLLEELTDEVRH